VTGFINGSDRPALLFGGGLSLLGAARSLGAAGIRSLFVSNRGDFATWSRFGRRVAVPPIDGTADLGRLLEAIPIKQAVLIPCTDEWLAVAAALPDSFQEQFPASLPPAGAVRAYTDKAVFAEALRTHEVPHPRTIRASDREAIERLSESEMTGFFLKPRNSQEFSLQYRIKALSVSGKSDAIAKIERFAQDGFAVELQEMIPGPVTRQYHIDGFVDRFGRVVAAMARQRLRMYPTDFGNTTLQVSIPMETLEAAIEPLHRLLEGLEHRGIFSAEFKWDERDRLFKLLEINARPWWQVEFSTLCGVNVCAMAYRDALGEELPAVSTYDVGRRFRILAHDFRAFRDLRSQGDETPLNWIASLRGAPDAIIRLADPWPALGFAREIASKLARMPFRRGAPTRIP
jgi:predicted ATP-grasp superfamily ATP-dependent carboligase